MTETHTEALQFTWLCSKKTNIACCCNQVMKTYSAHKVQKYFCLKLLVNLISSLVLVAVNNKIMSAIASSIVAFPDYHAVDDIRPSPNISTDKPVKRCPFSACDYLCIILLVLSVTSILVVPTVFLVWPAAVPYQVI